MLALGLPIILLTLSTDVPAERERIPYFARRFGTSCQTCHALPPRLNAFGEEFRRQGYRGPGLEARGTVPLAIWASSRFDALPDAPGVLDRTRAYLNRIELVSGGKVVAPWLTYFAEWRALSNETRGDGTLRDRSGRFEDLFVTAFADRLSVTVGQFRQVDQVDVSLRLGLSEPLLLAGSLAGSGGGTARQQSLRGFAPAGRSPAVRVAWIQPVGEWRWTWSAALPFPGEFSVPLNDAARVEASNELALDPKGVVLESFVRRGVTSYGAHGFYDHAGRYLINALVAGNRSGVYWTAMAGVEKRADAVYGRWSVEGEYVPQRWFALGARLENRAGDGAPPALLPYLVGHFPGTRYTLRLTAEQRLQGDRDATFVELGLVF